MQVELRYLSGTCPPALCDTKRLFQKTPTCKLLYKKVSCGEYAYFARLVHINAYIMRSYHPPVRLYNLVQDSVSFLQDSRVSSAACIVILNVHGIEAPLNSPLRSSLGNAAFLICP